MNLKLSTLAGAAALALMAGASQAATSFDADLAAPGVYFGAGNPNGHFTIETVDGVELGLRARPNPEVPVAPVSGNTYQVALGKNISFDYSFNPGADGSPVDLTGLSSLIRIVNLRTNTVASFSPTTFIPDNAHSALAPGGFQNSERLSFAFLNGAIPSIGNINYNNGLDTTYRIDFTVSGSSFGSISDSILVKQGAGGIAAPEPAAWGLMIAGFGLAGAALRRRRAVAA